MCNCNCFDTLRREDSRLRGMVELLSSLIPNMPKIGRKALINYIKADEVVFISGIVEDIEYNFAHLTINGVNIYFNKIVDVVVE